MKWRKSSEEETEVDNEEHSIDNDKNNVIVKNCCCVRMSYKCTTAFCSMYKKNRRQKYS